MTNERLYSRDGRSWIHRNAYFVSALTNGFRAIIADDFSNAYTQGLETVKRIAKTEIPVVTVNLVNEIK